ncbi:MAG: GcrA family cell cycle regulator [Phyllobacteriaceae bacterium]|nr:GcrA family cell cycle regulator [Phyllobacteriaceae bacterium]
MGWTDERIEHLKKLWADGLSASQIAVQLGGVSRNAVIGKVHRLKLTSRGRTNAAPTRPKKSVKTTVAQRPAMRQTSSPRMGMTIGATALRIDVLEDLSVAPAPRHLVEIIAPPSRKLKLTELTERTCKWPIGDPLHEDFHFCGNDSGESAPYCDYHSRIAYQPASERKRLR